MISTYIAYKGGPSFDCMQAKISRRAARIRRPACLRIGLVGVLFTMSTGISLPPSAFADSVATLTNAVTSARAQTSCRPLRSDPVVTQVTAKINQSTDDWLDHTATQIPIEDPHAGLKILGYRGSKAALLQGAAKTDAYAIMGLLLEGHDKIPDCSYTDFGVSLLRNDASGHTLTAVVLAGA